MSLPLLGFSGTPRSIAECQQTIDALKKYNLNLYRISFSSSVIGGGRTYHPEYIQYFLDNWNGYIIIDREHIYPPDSATSTKFKAGKEQAKAELLECALLFNGNPRVCYELFNEYVLSDYNALAEEFATFLKSNGITNVVIANKWNTAWAKIPNVSYQGYHYYFNSWSAAGALANVMAGLGAGLSLINTEVGASFNEAAGFTSSNVATLNTFLDGCFKLGVGNCVWLNYGVATNLSAYERLGLKFPTQTMPEIFECPYCFASFATQAELDAHIASAHPVQVFTCPTCGATFASQAELDVHFAANHPSNGHACLVAFLVGALPLAGAVRLALLTRLRSFRDRCLPVKLIGAYYRFGGMILR